MQTDRTSIPISILDLSPIVEGDSPRQALRNTLAFAQAQKTTSDYERGPNAQQQNTGLNQELLAKVRAQMAERDAARGQTPDMSQSR